MPKVSVKYRCGDEVWCGPVSGRVTAIFIRGKGRAYEFSYSDNNQNPASCNVEECELDQAPMQKVGFRNEGKRE